MAVTVASGSVLMSCRRPQWQEAVYLLGRGRLSVRAVPKSTDVMSIVTSAVLSPGSLATRISPDTPR